MCTGRADFDSLRAGCKINVISRDSGAETILGQGGGQDRERQSLEREIKFFAEIRVFFVPKTSVL